MTNNILLLPILIPLIAAVLTLVVPNRWRYVKESLALISTTSTLLIAVLLFRKNIDLSIPWAGFGFEFSLRCYNFSSFIMLAASFFALMIALYSSAFLNNKGYAKYFYAYFLITLLFVNGTVLAENLVLLLFFWEGLLLTLFLMIAIGNPLAFKTATKAFVIVGVSDLCFMVGAAMAGHISGTFAISKMSIPLAGLGGVSFILLMIGSIAKAGSMPFHTWIPDAAQDAPLPFMAFLPASIEKLVGIYFLARLSLDMFKSNPHSWASILMMSVGAITIILAVAMALIQKDYKRLLSYHAISQVGYMILGVGTLVPAGIIGGLFHMLNNSLYKCGLFLTGGAVEKQTGTTDLNKLGGLWKSMPITFACFVVTALSISGVPPFNGFFSKELVYDGALERGMIFYLAAVGGSFLTAASFLKLGHAAFIDKQRTKLEATKEAPLSMLVPMIVIAAICIIFGLWNSLPINGLITPSIAGHWLEGKTFAHFPANMMLVVVTIVVLIAALLNHIYGVKRSGAGLKAADHIYHAPVLSNIYKKAEKQAFDPYEVGLKVVNIVSKIASGIDKAIDWVYNDLSVNLSYAISKILRALQNGSYARYIIWAVSGAALVIAFLIRGTN
jgi:formate hydrogenlyase subunit 3/multisubunit Na+/H+ antiporter MnhD subunit